MKKYIIFIIISIFLSSIALASGNETNESFSKAKNLLEQKVYFDHRVTLYCGAAFDEKRNIILPEGFQAPAHEKRAGKLEWEHVVPAENFGRIFEEWREGSPQCTDSRGKAYKGRKCAEKASRDFRRMHADMYNLYPAIGAVNAMRQNSNFQMLPGVPSTFGSCPMKIAGNKVEPPAQARGPIARTYKYMQASYERYSMSRQQQQLMDAWDAMYPVDAWECQRAQRIEAVQGNENLFVKEPCRASALWP